MSETATVTTLTAEVRTLMVGNRQVTLSVYKQLDLARPGEADLMGRVRATQFKGPSRANEWIDDAGLEWVGRHKVSGALVRGFVPESWRTGYARGPLGTGVDEEKTQARRAFYEYVRSLDLIVLAGLK